MSPAMAAAAAVTGAVTDVRALAGSGVRCLIAPSFGAMFHANCLRNGILPIMLDALLAARAMPAAQRGAIFTVALKDQSITIEAAQAQRQPWLYEPQGAN